MKKAILTLAVLCGIGLVSCSKPTEEPPATIQGKWTCSSYSMSAYDYDTIIYMNEEVGKTWRFSDDGWFYIDGERQGNYEIEQVNLTTNPNSTMNIIHLYYETAEPYYHVERKSYAVNKLTKTEMSWQITDAMFIDDIGRYVTVDVQIQFNNNNK